MRLNCKRISFTWSEILTHSKKGNQESCLKDTWLIITVSVNCQNQAVFAIIWKKSSKELLNKRVSSLPLLLISWKRISTGSVTKRKFICFCLSCINTVKKIVSNLCTRWREHWNKTTSLTGFIVTIKSIWSNVKWFRMTQKTKITRPLTSINSLSTIIWSSSFKNYYRNAQGTTSLFGKSCLKLTLT